MVPRRRRSALWGWLSFRLSQDAKGAYSYHGRRACSSGFYVVSQIFEEVMTSRYSSGDGDVVGDECVVTIESMSTPREADEAHPVLPRHDPRAGNFSPTSDKDHITSRFFLTCNALHRLGMPRCRMCITSADIASALISYCRVATRHSAPAGA